MNVKYMHDSHIHPMAPQPYRTLEIQFDEEQQLAWYFMNPKPRPCCTLELIEEMQCWFRSLEHMPEAHDIRYVVLASDVPGIFNLGGDLEHFIELIRTRDRQGLLFYAESCIDTLLLNYHGLNQGITTMALVQGDCLGGGLEYALSSDILIAEKSAKMGLPEILFNLFPGMGAFSLLSRKIGPVQAERMITGGRLYSAEEMYELGVVDVLVDDGQGEQAVHDVIAKEQRAPNAFQMFRKSKKLSNPLTKEELMGVTRIWVDAALKIRNKDIRMMQRLVARQSSRVS